MNARHTRTTPHPTALPCPCGGYVATAAPGAVPSPGTVRLPASQAAGSQAPGKTQGKILYGNCCARLIESGEIPVNAEQLMRSRYTAYVLERFDYLRETWDPATCPADLGSEPGPQWLGLDVRRHEPLDDRHALVEFVARYKVGGRAHRLQELSRFVRGEDGRWRYVDGQISDR